ncbi:hypothetical protein NIES4074_39120 [Cylindrospermum sp. NIES-4074]|nr:hypothetical protein NIES4074_39120 [Cylindrospermum sp. NIES-4074]
MKLKLLVSAVVLSLVTTANGVAFAQTPRNATTPTTSKQETEKINNIKKLIEITGSRNLSQQITTQLIAALKSEYPQVPQKFWDTFAAELKPDEMIDEFIPIYGKYYTNEEIKQLIAFYETPLGKKTIRILPEISRESTAIGLRYGREAGERALKKLEAEGYLRRR